MELDVVKQVADIVCSLSEKELSKFLPDENGMSVAITADNVSLDCVELHSPTDEDYYDDFMDIAKSAGWEVSDCFTLRRGDEYVDINNIYIVGDFDSFVTDDGSYWDINTGKRTSDLARQILLGIAGGKYSKIFVERDILTRNIDFISSLIEIDEGVDEDDCSGNYLDCDVKESLQGTGCLSFFPNRGTVVETVDVDEKFFETIEAAYKGMVDGVIVIDSDGIKSYGIDYSGIYNDTDREALNRFFLEGYRRVLIVQDKGELSRRKCYCYDDVIMIM